MSLLAPDVVDDELYDWLPVMNAAWAALSKPNAAASKANVTRTFLTVVLLILEG